MIRSVDAYQYTIYLLGDNQGWDIPNVNTFTGNEGDSFETLIDRAIRSEADVLYIDPLRDAETARVVLKLQPNCCFISEFLAPDAIGGVAQFAKLVGNSHAAEGLRAVVSQRLLRLLCDRCKLAYRPNPKMLAKIGLPPETKSLYRPPSRRDKPVEQEADAEPVEVCEACGGSGYLGRSAIFELAEMTEELRKLVTAGGRRSGPQGPGPQGQDDDLAAGRAQIGRGGQNVAGRAATHLPAEEVSFRPVPTV